MTTIAYDKPVRDFVDQLSATGHVTHNSYRKTSVTLHHNAGRLSLQGILDVWKVRPASAHFQVDTSGDVGQYVKVNEYAWAVGNTAGNQSSISIEMANSTLAPDWVVSDTTWKSAARLSGWLFAKVIGQRPSESNFFRHKHWSSTACAGPHTDKVWSQIMSEAQASYDHFKSVSTAPAPTPKPSTAPRKSSTQLAAEVWAGVWGGGADRVQRLTAAGYDANAIQALVNRGVGKTSPVAAAPTTKPVSVVADEVIAGKWGNGDDRARRLKASGYSPAVVQAEVNRKLAAPAKIPLAQLVSEVIAGKWGNGEERTRRLRAANYDPAVVQSAVNRQLR